MPSPHRRQPHSSRGFTLIELIITVAVIAILASLAYPGYVSHIRKSRRAVATACLQNLAQQMERRYTTAMSYAGATLPATTCINDLERAYTFAFASGQPTATTFTLQATPRGPQRKDTDCMVLGLDQGGTQTRSGSADLKTCWP